MRSPSCKPTSLARCTSSRASHCLFALLFLMLTATAAHPQMPAGTHDVTQPAPENPQFAQAETALERKDYSAALPLLTALAAAHPGDANIFYDLGYSQDTLDHPQEAEAAYRQAIKLKTDYLDAHLALGLLLAREGHTDEALTELKTAAGLDASDPALKARAYRALAHLDQTASPDQARDALIEALRLSPETTDDTLLAAELAEAANDPATAEQAYRRLLAADANEPQAVAGLAHLLLHQQRWAEAESLLTASRERNPGNPTLSAQLVTVYLAENKSAEALPLAENLHTAHPQDANLTRLLAHLYNQIGKPEQADPLYAALIAQSPHDPTLLDDRADALIHLHRPTEAEALLKKAVAQSDAFPSQEDFGLAASHLAFAAAEAGDPAVVLQALALRAKVLPPSPSSLFLEATANDKLHQSKQAIALYHQFLTAAGGKFPEEESEARHRLAALEHTK